MYSTLLGAIAAPTMPHTARCKGAGGVPRCVSHLPMLPFALGKVLHNPLVASNAAPAQVHAGHFVLHSRWFGHTILTGPNHTDQDILVLTCEMWLLGQSGRAQ